ncbi:MAG: TolC family protein [Gemmatimonadaceae bacterium]
MTPPLIARGRAAAVLLWLSAAPAAGQAPAADSLHPISLDEAVRLAQRNAPAAVQARGQVRTSNSAVRSAYGAFLPNFNVTLGQSESRGRRQGPQGTLVDYVAPRSYSTGFNSSLTLFEGGRRFAELSQSRAEVGAAEANEVTQHFNIALQVKREYYNILAARESEAAARAQLEQAEQQLRAASARVRAGAATMSDSLRSVIQVGNARLALLTARNNVRESSAALSRLVATPFLVTAIASDTLDLPLAPLDSAALRQLAEHGPPVRQAEANYRAARAGVRASRASYLPTVDLNYRRSGSGFDPYYGVGGGSLAYSNTWSLGLSFPVFNNFAREDQIVRANVQEDVAEAQLRDARLLARQNLIQQLGALRTAEERIRIQQASVAAAQEDLRVQQQRYNLGASTLLDLLTSQTTLDNARAALIQARQDYRVARAQIEAIIGRDLP